MRSKPLATLITAAGGNGTAIQVLEQPLSRADYALQGKALGEETERYGAEQVGFLVPSISHFEMAGGEFCGNASRAAAILLAKAQDTPKVRFTTSGYNGVVTAFVTQKSVAVYDVRCEFSRLPTEVTKVELKNGQQANIVDLGGIVHVVIAGEFPSEVAAYQKEHRRIIEQLSLNEREAVGVVWLEENQEVVTIHPVVWVKAVDTFFYEKSCGSGAIAAAKVTNAAQIRQPTGLDIQVVITQNNVTLASEMEVIDTATL